MQEVLGAEGINQELCQFWSINIRAKSADASHTLSMFCCMWLNTFLRSYMNLDFAWDGNKF